MPAMSVTASPLKQAFISLAGPARRRAFATVSSLRASYGFIGLGQMGYPMAKNLRNKISESDSLCIYDVNAAACNELKKEVGRVEIADNVRELAERSETIFTVLPEPHHVQSVFRQILKQPTLPTDASITQQRLFIDCSTIDPKTSAEIAEATQSSGQGRFIDAPMSGGVQGARAGGLTFMIGAADDLVDRATQALSLIGKRVVHLGPQTSGLKGKLANNYLLALTNIATAEAMNIGVKLGLEPKTLAGMINTATGKCWPSEINNPVPGINQDAPASKDYAGGFGTSLMLKDLRLAIQAANEADIVPLLGAYAKEIYTAVQADEKCKDKDFSVVYRYLGGKEKF